MTALDARRASRPRTFTCHRHHEETVKTCNTVGDAGCLCLPGREADMVTSGGGDIGPAEIAGALGADPPCWT